jgi:DHA2 family multidrug resistance protein-like MFS transporter
MSDGERDGLPVPRRYGSVAAIWLAMAMAVLDTAIANIALPTIASDLGASPQGAIWVVNAYQIAIVMTLLPIAALGEIFGYRRVYGIGLLVFIAASLGCTMATSLTALAIARFLQGFGAAAIMALNGALVRFTYPRAMLGRGIGYNVLVVAIASAAGPSVAAAILALGSWRWLFAVNVPLGLLSFALGQRYLPDVPGTRGRFGYISSALNAAMFAAAFLAASDASHGRYGVRTGAELLLAILFAVLLVRRVRGQANPLIPIDLLRVKVLRLSYVTSVCSFAAQMLALVALPFYLQKSFGFGHVAIGLLITPWPLGAAVAAPIAGRLVERVPAGLLGGIGLAAMAAGLAALAFLPVGAGVPGLIAAMTLCGAGFGLFQAPNNRVLLGTAPPARSGAAAGMLAISRLVGQTAGAVIVALMFRLAGPAGRAVFGIGAGLAALAAVVSLRRLSAD